MKRRISGSVGAMIVILSMLGGCGGGGGGGGSSSATSGSGAPAAAATYPLALFAGQSGGSGNVDSSTPSDASFQDPMGVAVDNSGNIFVADTSNHKIRKIAANGVVSTLAGSGSDGRADGVGISASFFQPMGVAVDSIGNVYVSEYGNCTIRRITPTGTVTTIAGTAGVCGASTFDRPRGIAVDAAGNVYVADTANHVIKKIAPSRVVTTLAGSGSPGRVDGQGALASFANPTGLAVDALGNIFVADSSNCLIRKITPAGAVSTLAGTGNAGSADGVGVSASFNVPHGIAIDSAGNLVVSDSENYRLRRVSPAGVVSTLAGGTLGYLDGLGTSARFRRLAGLAIDGNGDAYVGDLGNTSIRKVTSAGVVTTAAGSAMSTDRIDGTGTNAQFFYPDGVAADSAGSIYVVEQVACDVRVITSAGVVSTVAVSGCTSGAALPRDIAVDSMGTMYIADGANHQIWKGTVAGGFSVLAGDGTTGSIDGNGMAARFNGPRALAVDANGFVYVADTLNCTIRKITPAGAVTTIAGVAGVCGPASLYYPQGVAVDASGFVFIADSGNDVIRKLTPAGTISLLAGSGVMGRVDGFGASASFTFPTRMTINSTGDLYVADTGSSLIRKVSQAGEVTTIVGTPGIMGFVGGTTPGVIRNPRGVAITSGSLYFSTGSAIARVTGLP